nr:hypothetical protein [Tanacetum cinerariifolium]
MNVARARKNVGSPVVQQSEIQSFNCKESGHFAKECRKPKRVKDFAYHKEKMNWKHITATLQRFRSNTCLVETDDSNVIPDSPDMCENVIQNEQNDVESDDERVALANLIANLKLDAEFEKYKAFNDRTVDYDKLERKLNETLGQLAQKDIEIKEGVSHKTNVSRPHHGSNQLKEKVQPNNSQLKLKKTQVEVHPRIPSVFNKMKSITACNDSLNSKTLNANVVCGTCNNSLVDSNHFACVTKMLNDVNARTKKPNVVPISKRKCKGQANKSVATPHKKKEISRSTWSSTSKASITISSQLVNFVMRIWRLLSGNLHALLEIFRVTIYLPVSSTPLCLMAKASPTKAWLWHRILSHLNFDYINMLSKKDIVIGLPKLKYVKDQLCSSCKLSKEKRSSFKSKAVPSSKGRLNLLHMDLSSKLPLFFWAEAIATACYTQTRSIIIPAHDKTAYHIINDRKPSIKHLHNFGCICYITRDGENLDKMKENRDLCILVGYSTQSKGYRVYNKRTRMIVESIHIRFGEIKEVSETSVANDTSGLVPQRQKTSDYDNSDPVPQR